MILNNYYYYFQSAISPKLCDDLLKYGLSQKTELGVTGGNADGQEDKENLENNIQKSKYRNSNVAFFDDRWVYNLIHPYVNIANEKADWNFQWDWSEPCQFTIYGTNQYYGWHYDAYKDTYQTKDNPNFTGKIRKLSVTVSLSDPNDYDGGDLEFYYPNPQKDVKNESKFVKCEQIRPRGSVVVFPSFVWHRVTPVTRGTRYSLVIWNLGNPYK